VAFDVGSWFNMEIQYCFYCYRFSRLDGLLFRSLHSLVVVIFTFTFEVGLFEQSLSQTFFCVRRRCCRRRGSSALASRRRRGIRPAPPPRRRPPPTRLTPASGSSSWPAGRRCGRPCRRATRSNSNWRPGLFQVLINQPVNALKDIEFTWNSLKFSSRASLCQKFQRFFLRQRLINRRLWCAIVWKGNFGTSTDFMSTTSTTVNLKS